MDKSEQGPEEERHVGPVAEKEQAGPSRRAVLSTGAALAALGVSAMASSARAQTLAAPAIATGTVAGRRFKGLVHYNAFGGGPRSESTFSEMSLLPIGNRHVQIRVEASAPCYSMVSEVLVLDPLQANPATISAASGLGGTAPSPPTAPVTAPRAAPPTSDPPTIHTANHTYVGIVEAIGPDVKRVKVGDRVVVGVTSQCGVCYQCLNGAGDMCQFTYGRSGTGDDNEGTRPFATMVDGPYAGANVIPALGIGGLSELSVAWEEFCCPVNTSLSSIDLALLGDQLPSGFATGWSRMKIFPGADVVIFGAGSIGLSAVLSAVAQSAGQIIVVEPIAARREMAMQLGATTVLDPWVDPDNLVQTIRDMCRARTENRFAGGHPYRGTSQGADFAIGTVGMQKYPPPAPIEQSPDPTGILPFQQTYAVARAGGNVMWLGLTTGSVALQPNQLAVGGKMIWPGQQGGLQYLRDVPRMVKLMEAGKINYRPMIQETYTLDKALDAIRAIGDRRIVASVVTMI